jgi:hypothetical protein
LRGQALPQLLRLCLRLRLRALQRLQRLQRLHLPPLARAALALTRAPQLRPLL